MLGRDYSNLDAVTGFGGLGTNDPNFGPTGSCPLTYRKSQVLDINGDGLPDFIQPEGGRPILYIHRGVKPDMLTHISEGSGHTVDVSYRPLADGTAYPAATDCAYPQHCGSGGLWAVSAHHLDLGTSLELSFEHTYGTPRSDVMAGGGWLGMDSHTVRDTRTGVKTSVSYDLRSKVDVPGIHAGLYLYRGRPTTREVVTPLDSGQVITRTWSYLYSSFLPLEPCCTPPPARLVVTPQSVSYTEREDQPAGSAVPSGIKRSWTLTTDYNRSNGFLMHETRTTGGETKQTDYTQFADDTDKWLIGLVKRVTTTYTTPQYSDTSAPGETVVRTVEYARDLSRGAITGVTIEPDSQDPSLHLETVYGLNDAGQVHTVTEKALDGTTRKTVIDYDPTSGIYPYQTSNPLDSNPRPSCSILALGCWSVRRTREDSQSSESVIGSGAFAVKPERMS